MTENSVTETFTPDAAPVKEVGDRTITAKWNVGQADADGWQPQAQLAVMHWMSTRSYVATLHVARVKDEGGSRTEMFTASAMANKVVILEQRASRFNRNTFNAVYENALAQLRSRFEDGDEAVTTYFDPTSD